MTELTEGQEPIPVIISVRAEEQQRDLIDQAARHTGRSREGFMLDAACREAQDVLLDQVFFLLDSQGFAQFKDMLDNPPPPSDRLRQLMMTKAPWE
jgi:uncharacterized protein (DUF1778 family)